MRNVTTPWASASSTTWPSEPGTFNGITANHTISAAFAINTYIITPTAGAHGTISVTANVAPRLCAQFQAATLAGDFRTALAINDRLYPLHAALFSDASPGPTKYALARLGKMTPEVRLPICEPSSASKAAVDAGLAHAGLI